MPGVLQYIYDNFGLTRDDFEDSYALNDFISSLFPGEKIIGSAGRETINGTFGDDVIVGRDSRDKIQGDAGDDFIHGNRGDDHINGDLGNDTIHGGSGNDTIYGDFGDDLLNGGRGQDLVTGGRGLDTFSFNLTRSFDTITDFVAGEDKLLFEGANPGLLTFTDTGADILISYNGSDIGLLQGVDDVPAATDILFA